jgi:alpha-glucosidase (family GH31 glycosyl hydrolase)
MTRVFILILSLLAVSYCSQYKVTSFTQNTSSYTLFLSYTGNDTYYVKPSSPIIKELVFTIRCLTNTDLTFKITDVNRTRFEVPQLGVFPIDPVGNFTFPINNSNFQFSYTANPFDFSIIRKFDNEVIFDSSKGNIIFSDYYLEISSPVASKYVYGFGERFSDKLALHTGKYTIFNRDRGGNIDRGDGRQTYGYYPAYMVREQAGNFHFGYLRSSNAMDVVVSNISDSQFLFTYKVIGGVIDFRFFLGEKNVEATIEKFQFYSGRSQIPPFWSLGFHQCRWGYDNVSALEAVLDGYEKNDIPLDTIWTDIDYMIDYEDFTIDEKRFPLDRMAKITQNYRYVPIIDAGIKTSGNAYEEGLKQNVFLKDADGKTYVGRVWPGATAFVDFFSANASKYWSAMLDNLYNKVKFSGIWLDMNELANFCDGPCDSGSRKTFDFSKDLPYEPGSDPIESHTVSLNATHANNVSEANLHAYFGFLES